MASRSPKRKKTTTKRKRTRPTKRQANAKLLREHRQFYDALFELQGGRCGICRKTPEEAYAKSIAKGGRVRKFDMDHNWVTMQVLGLLCSFCNKKKPDYVEDEWVENLNEYIQNPPFARLRT